MINQPPAPTRLLNVFPSIHLSPWIGEGKQCQSIPFSRNVPRQNVRSLCHPTSLVESAGGGMTRSWAKWVGRAAGAALD